MRELLAGLRDLFKALELLGEEMERTTLGIWAAVQRVVGVMPLRVTWTAGLLTCALAGLQAPIWVTAYAALVTLLAALAAHG